LLDLTDWFRVSVTELVTATQLSFFSAQIDDFWWVYRPGIHPGQSYLLSLAIPLWVGAMSTGCIIGHHWESHWLISAVLALKLIFIFQLLSVV